LWSFPPTAAFTSFPAPDCWACATAPAISGHGLFIYRSGRDSPPPNSVLRALHPLCYVSLLFLLLITQFLFFSLGGGQSFQGAMLIWPRVVCGSTMCYLALLVVCIFPSSLGACIWQRGGPPGFSI
jgi:hypothetical protein